MGVYYFNCDACRGIIADCNKYYNFAVVDYKNLTVCPDCANELSKKLTLTHPPQYPCWIVDNSMEGNNILFKGTFEEVRKWVDDKKDSNLEYTLAYYEDENADDETLEKVEKQIKGQVISRNYRLNWLDTCDDFLHLLNNHYEVWNVTKEFLEDELQDAEDKMEKYKRRVEDVKRLLTDIYS